MAPGPLVTVTSLHHVGLDDLRQRWGWFLGLGILLVLLGSIAIGSSVLVTLATMVLVGWLMVLAGVLQTAHAFACRGWSGFFMELISGVMNLVVGFLFIARPGAAAEVLTMMIALALLLSGIFRIAVALSVPFHNRWWMILNGALNVMMGILIINKWPSDALWVIGLFIGIDMLFNGWSLIMLGLGMKNLPASTRTV